MRISFALIVILAASSLAAQNDPTTNPQLFDRYLVPVFTNAVHGSFGSEFYSSLSLWNKSDTQPLRVWGLQEVCVLSACPPPPDFLDVPAPTIEAPLLQPNGNPGRFVFVEKAQSNRLAANLRVYDASRDATNFGTELPVVRQSDFAERIVLPGVPMTPRFRNVLRIYSAVATDVTISFGGPDVIGSPTITPPPQQTITLREGENVFDPAYASFANFPSYPYPLTIVVDSVSGCPVCLSPPVPPAPIWAFVSVTNNETQHITTITPQP
ncbi:MAG: hypothetical protein JO197_04495 [Acidobacteria bacterium]|nr:hypothetical protein [Acidobacteriota bacterium]